MESQIVLELDNYLQVLRSSFDNSKIEYEAIFKLVASLVENIN